MEVKIPKKLQFLFQPAPYKVARGGRGALKSWSFARALLVLGMKYKLRILCAREIQTSIKQSVHQLLKDQISLLGLGWFYDVLDNEIRGQDPKNKKAGSALFTFTGLSSLTVDTIKSYEGYDIAWIEEGQAISDRSWDILDPTIRKSKEESSWGRDAEIWISYNPELESDPTHQRFTINPPPGTINVEINWRDADKLGWFSDLLNKKRLHCLENNPDDYDWIWEGKCKPAVAGAIFFKQIQEAETNRRIREVPHDPMLKVHPVLDLGWDDSLATALIQVLTSEIRFIEYLEFSHTDLANWSNELRTRPYNWGRVWLPFADGYSGRLESGGKSSADIIRKLGWDVPEKEEIANISEEDGIRHTRMQFKRMYFDKEKCAALKAPKPTEHIKHTELSHRLIECLKRFHRNVNVRTQTTGKPVRDPHKHGGDCTRYVALNADDMTNDGGKKIIIPGTRRGIIQRASNRVGSWMGQ